MALSSILQYVHLGLAIYGLNDVAGHHASEAGPNIRGGSDGTRTRDLLRDRQAF